MAIERTLSIIKPDATARNITGRIIARLEEVGLRVVAQKRVRLSREQAQAFYFMHAERPFFGRLCDYMTSGPIVVQVLEGEDAIHHYRAVMGPTNPAEAAPGTLRGEFAESTQRNAVHGADSPENARREIAFFFAETDIVG